MSRRNQVGRAFARLRLAIVLATIVVAPFSRPLFAQQIDATAGPRVTRVFRGPDRRLNRQLIDVGDHFNSGRGDRPLRRRADAVAIRYRGVAKLDLIASLTSADGPLPGFILERDAGPDILILAAPSDSFPSPDAQAHRALLGRVRNFPGVASARPIFADLNSGLSMLPSEEIIVCLDPAVDPAAYFGADWPSVRPVRSTHHQFIQDVSGLEVEELLSAVSRHAADPRVRWAEPNFLSEVNRHFIPNDPLIGTQWQFNNTGQGGGTAGADANVFEAWSVTSGSSNIVIALLDDGVQLDHPDLAANIFHNPAELNNGLDNDGNGYPGDVNGWDFTIDGNDPNPAAPEDMHGTATAGIAAAVGGNAIGVSGVAGRCKILPVKVIRGTTFIGNAALAEAVRYAGGVDDTGTKTWRGADVISISLALVPSAAIDDAINDVTVGGRDGKGCPIFASSGNSASGWYYYEVTGIGSGTHTFTWQYLKDFNRSGGEDAAWLDDVQFPDGSMEKFEGATFPPAGWTTFGGAPWRFETRRDHVLGTGIKSARSGSIGNSQVSTLQRVQTLSKGGTISFWGWVSSETGYDFMNFLVDGVSKYHETGVPDISSSVAYPASNPSVMAVGASTDFDLRSDYSQYGGKLDFVAPSDGGSSGILTTDRTGSDGYNPLVGSAGNYMPAFGGTSAACPFAAGVAALMLSVNPDLTPALIRSRLHASCDKIGNVNYTSATNLYFGYGRINAQNAVASANLAPSISQIPSKTISEDSALVNVSIQLSDPDTAPGTLNFWATSSEPTIVPDANIFITGSGTNRLLGLLPATNQFGTVTITLHLSDGFSTVTNSFILSINPVNDPPTLVAPSDIVMNEDDPPLDVLLTGIGTGAANENQSLVLTATSSDPAIIANPVVTYVDGATTALLTLAPAANANGDVTITVQIEDGQSQNSSIERLLHVQVQPVNDPPTLSPVLDQVVNPGSLLQITNRADDIDSTVLRFSLEPGAPAGASIDPDSGLFSWQPSSNQSGSTNRIGIRVMDDGVPALSAVRSFTVIVNQSTAPMLAPIGISANHFVMELRGNAGANYDVESSADLISWNWLLSTNAPSATFQIIDPRTVSGGDQFYRAKPVP